MEAAAAVEDAGDSLLYFGDDSVKAFLFPSTLHNSERITTGKQTVASNSWTEAMNVF